MYQLSKLLEGSKVDDSAFNLKQRHDIIPISFKILNSKSDGEIVYLIYGHFTLPFEIVQSKSDLPFYKHGIKIISFHGQRFKELESFQIYYLANQIILTEDNTKMFILQRPAYTDGNLRYGMKTGFIRMYCLEKDTYKISQELTIDDNTFYSMNQDVTELKASSLALGQEGSFPNILFVALEDLGIVIFDYSANKIIKIIKLSSFLNLPSRFEIPVITASKDFLIVSIKNSGMLKLNFTTFFDFTWSFCSLLDTSFSLTSTLSLTKSSSTKTPLALTVITKPFTTTHKHAYIGLYNLTSSSFSEGNTTSSSPQNLSLKYLYHISDVIYCKDISFILTESSEEYLYLTLSCDFEMILYKFTLNPVIEISKEARSGSSLQVQVSNDVNSLQMAFVYQRPFVFGSGFVVLLVFVCLVVVGFGALYLWRRRRILNQMKNEERNARMERRFSDHELQMEEIYTRFDNC